MTGERMARATAGLIAIAAIIGLIIQFAVSWDGANDLGRAIWILLRFFTMLTNILVAILFGAYALGRFHIATPSRMGGVTLALLLVGIVYALLLSRLHHLAGGAIIANALLHRATPVMALLWWLLLAPKGHLTRKDPWIWMIYPLAYLAYALVRGSEEGVFAYPFLDFSAHGWPHVIAHVVVMAGCFLIVGHMFFWIDQRQGRRRLNEGPMESLASNPDGTDAATHR
ncbi:MAG: Pr6Pr family membrane protein [Sphingobium sp.]